MKAEVITAYTDRFTYNVHYRGETVELSEERAKELAAGGFVKLEQAKKAPRRRAAKKAE